MGLIFWFLFLIVIAFTVLFVVPPIWIFKTPTQRYFDKKKAPKTLINPEREAYRVTLKSVLPKLIFLGTRTIGIIWGIFWVIFPLPHFEDLLEPYTLIGYVFILLPLPIFLVYYTLSYLAQRDLKSRTILLDEMSDRDFKTLRATEPLLKEKQKYLPPFIFCKRRVYLFSGIQTFSVAISNLKRIKVFYNARNDIYGLYIRCSITAVALTKEQLIFLLREIRLRSPKGFENMTIDKWGSILSNITIS